MIPKPLQALIEFTEYPPYLNQKLIETWRQFKHSAPSTDRGRLIDLLNFFAVLKSQGLTADLLFSDRKNAFNPSGVYKELLTSEFSLHVLQLAKFLRKTRLLDVFRIHSTRTQVNTRRPYYVSVALTFVPRRSEHLDGALAKCEGSLYRGDVPIQLRERWRRLPANSKSRPKSLLPRAQDLMNSELDTQSLPLLITDACVVHVRRAAGNQLVLHFRIRNDGDYVSWCSRPAWEKELKVIITQAMKNLGN